MGKINLLPPSVAELIAAGEVIDRPASIVKELVENSLDAGANRIAVELRNGGITYLRVTDNGSGIGREDLPVAFVRHATSKIATADDLDAIMTLGFRGEALPSIAAVSRVCVTTRTAGSPLGCRYTVTGGDEGELEDAGCAVGTTFEVRDVFYNTPARMKFLKKDITEGNAVASLLDRLALANPAVSFELIRDGRRVLQTPGDGNLRSVIRLVCGADVAAAMIPVGYSQDGVTVSGMISKPSVARSTRSLQTFFINSRYIRSRTCAGAVEEAYKNRLMTGRFPACVLNLELDSSLVDVNVHPAKLEVRFSSERTVYNAVYSACLAALSQGERREVILRKPVTPFSLSDFDHSDWQISLQRAGTAGLVLHRASEEPAAAPLSPKHEKPTGSLLNLRDDTGQSVPVWNPPPEQSGSPETGKVSHWNDPPVSHCCFSVDIEKTEPPTAASSTVKQNDMTVETAHCSEVQCPKTSETSVDAENASASHPFMPPAPLASEEKKQSGYSEEAPIAAQRKESVSYRVIGELFDTYVLIERGDELLLIDKHAAHERAIYNRIRSIGEKGGEERQLLLTPRAVTLPHDEYFALSENPQALEALGIVAEDFGEGALLVREVPLLLLDMPLEELLEETAKRVLSCKASLTPSALDELLYSVSCKAAVKAGNALGRPELERIAAMVLEDDAVRYCPHGRPVLLPLTKREIGKMFGRLG